MSATKSALKAAKSALDKQDFDVATTEARKVIEADPQNYYGHLFLGRALEKQNKLLEAVETYKAASSIKPDDELGWKGLCNAYESLGAQGVDGYLHSGMELAKIYVQKEDAYQCQSIIDKLVDISRDHGTREQYKRGLHTILPDSPVFQFLEGRLQNPALTYTRLAEITETEEKEKINKEIGERRTRLGANLSQVTSSVKREVFSNSELGNLFREVINWTMDDTVRREFEEKLFQRALDHLAVLPKDEKPEKRDEVMRMARDIVVIKHPFLPAWELYLEWDDVEDLDKLDANVLREFILFFPSSGLAKVFQGYVGESVRPKNSELERNGEELEEEQNQEEEKIQLSEDERLVLLTEGLENSKKSYLARRIVSQHYLQIEEYESCVDVTRQGLSLLDNQSRKSGLKFELDRDALNLGLGISLVYYQSPKNHPEAGSIFEEILKRKPDSTDALLGTGLILEERAEFKEASAFLDKAFARDPNNVRIGVESAWCKVLTGEVESGLNGLETCFERLDPKGSLELKSLILYRIGRALWELKPDKSSRKDRTGAYQRFISSLKANPNYAPAYTSLGIYYSDYGRDKKRARQCFQKAFDLSAGEIESAERLARAFANDAEWDIVEIIAQRVIDSGVVRPAPGSKKKGISWPFAALGIVQMNKQEYPKAVISFQAALRISPSDYNSWVGLGESYHSSGRYIAAQRALEHALELANTQPSNSAKDTWFAEYMLANVLRELGEYDAALEGYRKVSQARSNEFGVMISLLQTLVEKGWHNLDSGFFGRAADSGAEAISVAAEMLEHAGSVFNFWKAIGDICALFSSLPGYAEQFPVTEALSMFENGHIQSESIDLDFDSITIDSIKVEKNNPDEQSSSPDTIQCILYSTIIAYKRAIIVSQDDKYAQAVAWYNLGWAEHRARIALRELSQPSLPKQITRFAKAAVRCFKKAIELEAGNAEFWNALGVATTGMNGRVAQHSFVRSLHLNSRSARTWTNLGTLYLIENDHELAHTAFARAQSTDPDFAHAWVGEGLIALALGDPNEALSHFTHAMEIADASSKPSKSHYVVAAYDRLAHVSKGSLDISETVGAIFSLLQLLNQALQPSDLAHLVSLLQERIGDYYGAMENLERVCVELEARYEATEDPNDMGRFAVAKSDLARNQVALEDFTVGSNNAETALDLLSDQDPGGLSEGQRTKARLSAHLTAGLAKHNLGDADGAIDMFRAALEESNSDPDVICLLAQVLWAKGSENERTVAKDQLFECIENNPGHAQATQLIGAMAAVENDASTKEAVFSDLQQMRTSDQLLESQKRDTERLLAILVTLESTQSGDEKGAATKAMAPIMLTPFLPGAWTSLANISQESSVAEMALKAAIQSVPPRGDLDSKQLSKAFANSPSIANAQKSIALDPWSSAGWQALKSRIR